MTPTKNLEEQVEQVLAQKSTKIYKNDAKKIEELEKEMLQKIEKPEADIQVLQQRTWRYLWPMLMQGWWKII